MPYLLQEDNGEPIALESGSGNLLLEQWVYDVATSGSIIVSASSTGMSLIRSQSSGVATLQSSPEAYVVANGASQVEPIHISLSSLPYTSLSAQTTSNINISPSFLGKNASSGLISSQLAIGSSNKAGVILVANTHNALSVLASTLASVVTRGGVSSTAKTFLIADQFLLLGGSFINNVYLGIDATASVISGGPVKDGRAVFNLLISSVFGGAVNLFGAKAGQIVVTTNAGGKVNQSGASQTLFSSSSLFGGTNLASAHQTNTVLINLTTQGSSRIFGGATNTLDLSMLSLATRTLLGQTTNVVKLDAATAARLMAGGAYGAAAVIQAATSGKLRAGASNASLLQALFSPMAHPLLSAGCANALVLHDSFVGQNRQGATYNEVVSINASSSPSILVLSGASATLSINPNIRCILFQRGSSDFDLLLQAVATPNVKLKAIRELGGNATIYLFDTGNAAIVQLDSEAVYIVRQVGLDANIFQKHQAETTLLREDQ